MRRLILSLALLLAAAPALPVLAQANSPAAEQEACMREIRASLKAGQKLTAQQRMVAEEQCRARAEAAAQAGKK